MNENQGGNIVDVQKQYANDLIGWLENFLSEAKKDKLNYRVKNEYINKTEDLLTVLHQRKILDPFFLRQLEKEAEQLYISYLNSEAEVVKQHERNDTKSSSRVPIGGHKLPPLPYPYEALEPYIQARIMKLHHQKHHQSYVDGLNKAEKELEKQRKNMKFELIKHWKRELAFNGAGHYLHTLFWQTMSPKGGGKPGASLARQLELDFNSFTSFQAQFTEAAKSVEGSGWAILVWVPRAGRLEILTAEKHQNLTQWDCLPLLPLDVWEHAYYLQYENERERYINNWWNIVDWRFLEKRFNMLRTNVWLP